jgi:hypothetical protein
MALTQHYFTNGSGRDTYISCDNGGFRPGIGDLRNSNSSNDLWAQFRKNPPPRLRLPGITSESRRFMASRQRQSCKRLSTPKPVSPTAPLSFFPNFDDPEAKEREFQRSLTFSHSNAYKMRPPSVNLPRSTAEHSRSFSRTVPSTKKQEIPQHLLKAALGVQ